MPAMLLVNTMTIELSPQGIEMLLFLTINMAAMTSRANQQYNYVSARQKLINNVLVMIVYQNDAILSRTCGASSIEHNI